MQKHPLRSADFCTRDELHSRMEVLRRTAAKRQSKRPIFGEDLGENWLRRAGVALILLWIGILLGAWYVNSIDALAARIAGVL